jgi:hypothetical protein
MGCCYSCVEWEWAPKRIPFTLINKEMPRIDSNAYEIKEDTRGFLVKEGDKLKVPSWVKYCLRQQRLVKAWECCENFRPRFVYSYLVRRSRIKIYEEESIGYLACHLKEGCPFQAQCEQIKASYL